MVNEKNRLNCLVLGKSGAGKSALLNYLIGSHVAETGVGDAVTPKTKGEYTGIYPFDPIDQGNYQLCIYDSWGIEADKADEWKGIVDDKIYTSDRRLDVSSWFHAALYCIDGKGARLESYELESIIKPLLDKGVGITFVLTKADIASQVELDGLKALLRTEVGEDALVCEACSEEKELRGGKVKRQFGHQAIFSSILFDAKRNLARKMGQSFDSYLDGRLEEWRSALLMDYRSVKWWGETFKRSYAEKMAKSRLNEVMIDVSDVYRALRNEVFQTYAVMYGLALWRAGSDGYQTLGEHAIEPELSFKRGYDEITVDFLFGLIPIINFVYAFARKQAMEDLFTDKLDEVEIEIKSKVMEIVNRDVTNLEEKVDKASEEVVIALDI